MLLSVAGQLSFHDYRLHTGHGGPRRGAGRKAGPRPIVHHVRRERASCATPALVTLRVRAGCPSLRSRRFVFAIRAAFVEVCERPGFRIAHYSIQRDHLHLVVEADDHEMLGRAMRSVAARVANAVQRVFALAGRILAGRYHVRWLRTPTEVRNALRYVLLNVRKHCAQATGMPPPVRLDEASSGRWFDGWRGGPRGSREGVCEIAPPRTWLLRVGWRRLGPIDPAAVPGPTRRWARA